MLIIFPYLLTNYCVICLNAWFYNIPKQNTMNLHKVGNSNIYKINCCQQTVIFMN